MDTCKGLSAPEAGSDADRAHQPPVPPQPEPSGPTMTTSATGLDRATVRGIGAMIIALFGFVGNDAFVKYLSSSMPLGEIIFCRGMLAAAAIAVLITLRKEWPTRQVYFDKAILLRNIGELGGTICYLTALTQLPLANAAAILQAMPFVITAAAAILLRETVGWRRWASIFVGFFGVLLIVRPGAEGFNGYSIMAVIAVGFLALRDMATRYVAKSIPTLAVTFVTTLAVTMLGAIMGLFETWIAFDVTKALLICGASAFLMLGYIFVIIAMREGEVSIIAPFRYTIVLWAIIIDFLIWSQIPSALTIAGIVIIITSGVYMFIRERRVASQTTSN